jgi:hypothetical protein
VGLALKLLDLWLGLPVCPFGDVWGWTWLGLGVEVFGYGDVLRRGQLFFDIFSNDR